MAARKPFQPPVRRSYITPHRRSLLHIPPHRRRPLLGFCTSHLRRRVFRRPATLHDGTTSSNGVTLPCAVPDPIDFTGVPTFQRPGASKSAPSYALAQRDCNRSPLRFRDDLGTFQSHTCCVLAFLGISAAQSDIRGVGLQVSKLEGAYGSKVVHQKNSILPWLVSTSAEAVNRQQTSGLSKHGGQDSRRLSDGALGQPSSSITGSYKEMGAGLASFETGVRQSTSLPPLQDLDVVVIKSLPPEVVSEINDMYSGKLLGFISENKRKTSNSDIHAASTRSIEDLGVPVEDPESLVSGRFVESNAIAVNSEVIRAGEEAPPNLVVLASFSVGNIMPSSLSEIDHSVLQQLPDEVRRDIIDLLPGHREPEVVRGAPSDSTDRQTEAVSEFNDIWIGNPPKWVEMFKISNCSMLNYFAQMYQSVSGGCLSSLLRRMMSGIFTSVEMETDAFDVVSWLCELFRQYIDLKIATDIEEIYACTCLLRITYCYLFSWIVHTFKYYTIMFCLDRR